MDNDNMVYEGQGMSGTSALAWLLLIVGLCMMAYHLWFFETTVETAGTELLKAANESGKVHNIGLISTRECGCIVGAGFAIVGAILAKR